MPIKQESINRDLYGLLKSHGYKPDLFNSSGKKVSIPEEAEAFQFEFIKDGQKYGKVTATIDGLHRLILYYGEDVNDSPKANSDTSEGLSFTDLRKHLKRFAKTRGLGFELKNEDNLEADMAKRDYTKREEISEGYYPISKTKSYSDNVPSTKIIIQHSKVMQEGEQRFRSIEKIFVENVNGERFLLPTNKPGIARVYARHISEGGTPYDDRGTHLTSLVEEYSKMAGFVRATKGKQFNESAQRLINEGINHYSKLRETLHKMAGKKGYREYFDNYSPALMEDETAADLSEMFLQSSLDPRIETVMPILSKLSKSLVETENNEVKELEEWADSIIGDSLELDEQQLDEKCWDTHKQVGMKKKGSRMVPNCVPKEAVAEDSLNELFEPQIDYYQLANGKIIQASYRPLPNLNAVPGTVKISYINPALKPQGSSFDSTGRIKRWDKAPDGVKQAIQKFVSNPNQGVAEGHEMCPECGGAMYSEEMINEKKDACYYKVKSRYKVWPSAYASGALVKCRKKGAKNWGSKTESMAEGGFDIPEIPRAPTPKPPKQPGVVEDNSQDIVVRLDGETVPGRINDIDHARNKASKLISYGKGKVAEVYVNGKLKMRMKLNTPREYFDERGVAEGVGNLAQALDKMSGGYWGWHQDEEESRPDLDVYHFDDGEGGFYATGIIKHNLKTDKVYVKFDDRADYYGENVDQIFPNIGAALKSLSFMRPEQDTRGRSYDVLATREPVTPDDLYKSDRVGRKGALSGGAANRLKDKIRSAQGRLGPKGELPRPRPRLVYSKQDMSEAGPFSYGAKKPRKGSVADLAAKKRQEQEKNKKPIEPKDQMVGTARVKKDVDEGFDELAAYMKAAIAPKPRGGAGIKRGTYGQPGRRRGRPVGPTGGEGSNIPHAVDFDRPHSERSAGRRLPRFIDDYDAIRRSDVDENSVRDKLHRRHQELRKKSGLPDPDYYKEFAKSYDIEDDKQRMAVQAAIKRKYKVK